MTATNPMQNPPHLRSAQDLHPERVEFFNEIHQQQSFAADVSKT